MKEKINKLEFNDLVLLICSSLFIIVPSIKYINVPLFTAILLIFVIFILFNKGIRIDYNVKKNILITVFYFICLFSVLYSMSIKSSVNYCIILTIAFVVYFYFVNKQNWIKTYIFILYLLAILNSLFTILSFLNFDIFIKLSHFLVNDEVINFAINTKRLSNAYSGLMGQTGTNAFIIAPMLFISFNEILEKKKIFLNIILFAITLFAIMLTKKRGTILWGIIALIAMLVFHYFRKNKKMFKLKYIFVPICIILLMFIFSYFYIPVFQTFIDGIINNINDISSGRFELYVQAIKNIIKYPIGIGIDAYSALFGENVHNELLQLTAEISIFGMLSIFLFLIISLFNGIKNYLYYNSASNSLIFIGILFYLILSCFTSFPIHNYGFFLQLILSVCALNVLSKGGDSNENRD